MNYTQSITQEQKHFNIAPIIVQQTISTHGLETLSDFQYSFINVLANATESITIEEIARKLNVSKRQLYDVINEINTNTQRYFIGTSRKHSDKGVFIIDANDPNSMESMRKSLKAKEQHATEQLKNVAKTSNHFEEVFFRTHGYKANLSFQFESNKQKKQ